MAPRLLESRANIDAAQGRADQAATLPNPAAGVLFENIGGGGNGFNGLSTEQTTLSLSEPVELWGKRSARIAAGSAEVSAAQARNQQLLAEFGYDLALAYVAAEAAETRTKLSQDAAGAAKEDLRRTQALVDSGREAGIRAKQADAAALAAQSELESVRADVDTALARLSQLVAAPEAFTGVVPSLLPLADRLGNPTVATPKVFPALAVAEAEREAAWQRLNVERTRSIPDVTATLGVRRLMGDKATVLVAGVSMPIPVFDRNSGNIAAAGAELAAADARLAAARADAQTGWQAAIAQANAVLSRLAAANSAASAAEEAYGLTRIGYESGKTSLLDLLTVRRGFTEAQLRLLDARVARIRAEAALARLAGQIPFEGNP